MRAPQTLFKHLAENDNLTLGTVEMDVRDSDSVQRAVDMVHTAARSNRRGGQHAGLMSIGLAEGFTEECVLSVSLHDSG